MRHVFVGIVAILIVGSAGYTAAEPTTLSVSFQGDGLRPGYEAARPDQLSWGPSSLVVTKNGFLLADPVHSRVLEYTHKGEAVGSIACPFPPAQVWVSASGSAWVVDGPRERAAAVSGHNAGQIVRLPEKTNQLFTGPGDKPWVLLSSGFSVPLVGKSGLARATPLGNEHHGVGRRVARNQGEVLIWAWSNPAEVKGKGPLRVLGFETDTTLGSIRPLHMGADGTLFVHIEKLAPGPVVQVTHEITRVQRDGTRAHISWPASQINPHLESFVISPEGTLHRSTTRPDGLQVFTYKPSDWEEVAR